ncbi:MAG TPA: outer membrane beta-barrel protein [Ohtaekwangia sp.]
MERRKFENAFKDAFAEAKVDPSENVWINVELDLARAEGGELKRRLFFYKLVAAASVAFAMCVAGVGYYTVQNTKGELQLAERHSSQMESEETTSVDQSANASLNESAQQANEASAQQSSGLSSSGQGNQSAIVQQSDYSRGNTRITYGLSPRNSANDSEGFNMQGKNNSGNNVVPEQVSTNSSMNPQQASSLYASTIQKLPKEVSAKGITIEDQKVEPDPVMVMMAKLEQKEKELREEERSEKTKKSESLWTSVGFAAGAFNTVHASGSGPSASATSFAATKVADKQADASGVSYTVGVSMGTRLSNRWVLQGGVNYMTQSSDYTANAVVTSDYNNFKAGSLNEIQSADGDFLASAAYNVNNNLQFFSVPLQAGYLIVDKKFGVQLNAGVSTDLFIQNTITPESDVLSRTTQGRGEDSPYRPVNFSGLLGTELTYRLGEHYRLAVNPGIRYPFNSIYKSELGIEAMPLTFDVGLKFRYIFH